MKKILLFIVGLFGIFGTCFGAGIYNNPDNTLISVSVDGENWLTYESFDYGYLSGAVCMFQYGNNHCFTTGINSVSSFSNSVDFTPFSYNGFSTGNLFVYNGAFNGVIGSNSNFLNFALNTWGAQNSSAIVQGPCNEGFHIMNFDEANFLVNSNSVFGLSKCQAPSILFSQDNAYSLNADGVSFNTMYQGRRYLGGGYNITKNFFSVSNFYRNGNNCDSVLETRTNYFYNAFSIRCVKDSPVFPNSSWFVRTGDIITSPKFKINYGNTFTEYELTDNLSIYLKSPVVMSGITEYIYDGSTGINLFYNGSSQRYNKTELYLNTPSWYNNNIFTPICL